MRYANAHNVAITPIVFLPMLLELVTASLLLFDRPPNVSAWAAWIGLGLVGIIWLSTAFLQVPQHTILGSGFDVVAHSALVQSNWIRTVAWSLRSALLLWLLTKIW